MATDTMTTYTKGNTKRSKVYHLTPATDEGALPGEEALCGQAVEVWLGTSLEVDEATPRVIPGVCQRCSRYAVRIAWGNAALAASAPLTAVDEYTSETSVTVDEDGSVVSSPADSIDLAADDLRRVFDPEYGPEEGEAYALEHGPILTDEELAEVLNPAPWIDPEAWAVALLPPQVVEADGMTVTPVERVTPIDPAEPPFTAGFSVMLTEPFTMTEVGVILDVSRDTVKLWTAQGLITASTSQGLYTVQDIADRKPPRKQGRPRKDAEATS